MAALGRARGIALADDVEERTFALLETVPAAAKSSMQVDFERGKRTELEQMGGAVVRMGRESRRGDSNLRFTLRGAQDSVAIDRVSGARSADPASEAGSFFLRRSATTSMSNAILVHLGIATTDLDRSMLFWRDLLGFVIVDPRPKLYVLSDGLHNITVFERSASRPPVAGGEDAALHLGCGWTISRPHYRGASTWDSRSRVTISTDANRTILRIRRRSRSRR